MQKGSLARLALLCSMTALVSATHAAAVVDGTIIAPPSPPTPQMIDGLPDGGLVDRTVVAPPPPPGPPVPKVQPEERPDIAKVPSAPPLESSQSL